MENDKKQNEVSEKRNSATDSVLNKKIYQIKDEGNQNFSNYGKIEIFNPKKVRTIVANKIIFINNLHDFFYNFSNNIYNTFNKINLFLQKKLENTLDQNKYFLKFFNKILFYIKCNLQMEYNEKKKKELYLTK